MADMVNGYEIRWAEDKDWIPAMHMIWKTFLKYEAVDYTEEGIRNFHEFITDEHLYKSFRQGRYQMMVALDGARIIGAASVRNYNHLSRKLGFHAVHEEEAFSGIRVTPMEKFL